MSKLLQDIWIMTHDGTVLFKRVFEEKLNEQLFGGFMSALETFASQLDDHGLSSFEIGSKKFILKKGQGCYFVANFDKKVNPKKAQAELEEVAKKFIGAFQVELMAFRGDVETFKGFEKQIEDSLEDVVQKFQDSFW
ncbi:MAG: hypothetical protein JW839_15690 [Candidatus Lokiarchaeota archaeon]|nr:hypothetical protein [Candidatus Lokiarchaeota archaeon]